MTVHLHFKNKRQSNIETYHFERTRRVATTPFDAGANAEAGEMMELNARAATVKRDLIVMIS